MFLDQPLYILIPLIFFYYLLPVYLGYYTGRSSKSLTTLLLPAVIIALFYFISPSGMQSSTYINVVMLPVIVLLCAGGGFGILRRKVDFNEVSPYIIGLTGLPCSGKSEVSRIFQELGAMVIDVDKLGHSVLENPAVIAKLYSTFGEEVLTEDEQISRKELGRIVFDDDNKLSELEAIVHPAMTAKIQETVELLAHNDILVLDAAILHKMNLHKICDRVLVVHSDAEIRLTRATTRKWDKTELEKRDEAVKKQMRLNDITLIENNSTINNLIENIQAIWKDILNER